MPSEEMLRSLERRELDIEAHRQQAQERYEERHRVWRREPKPIEISWELDVWEENGCFYMDADDTDESVVLKLERSQAEHLRGLLDKFLD